MSTLGSPRNFIGWVIVGGESGPKARPMHPDWARSLRDQCQAAGVPFFFKQWGEWLPCTKEEYAALPDGKRAAWGPDVGLSGWRIGDLWRSQEDITAGRPSSVVATTISRVGKAVAGRLLDGREWSEFPTVNELAGVR
jgi:protein gp37